MKRLAVMLLLGACAHQPPTSRPTPPAGADGPHEVVRHHEVQCRPQDKATLLKQALATLPVDLRVEVDSAHVLHLHHEDSALDAKSAAVIASVAPPFWATEVHLHLAAKALSAESARALAKWGAERPDATLVLHLNHVAALSEDVALALAEWRGYRSASVFDDYPARMEIELNGLTTLTAPVARALLERWSGGEDRVRIVHLLGVKEYVPDGLETLRPADGQVRAVFGDLRPDVLSQIPGDHAPHESEPTAPNFAGCALTVEAVRALSLSSNELQRALAEWEPIDPAALIESVPRATAQDATGSLTAAMAAALADTDSASLRLDRVESLTPAAAAELAKFDGRRMYLNGLSTLDAETALALAGWSGRKLELDGIEVLDAKVAAALATWGGRTLELDGLRHLDEATARALAKWGGRSLELDGLETLDVSSIRALSSWSGTELELDGLRYLDPAALEALMALDVEVVVAGRWIGDGVDQPAELNPRLSDLLGLPPGTLTFVETNTIRVRAMELTAARAGELAAACTLDVLDLDGLRTLTAGVAAKLANWKGVRLRLNGLKSLDAEAAEQLAKSRALHIELRGLTELDTAVIDALAPIASVLELNGCIAMPRGRAGSLPASAPCGYASSDEPSDAHVID